MINRRPIGTKKYIVCLLFVTTLGIFSLQGCGSTTNASQGEPNPPGVYTDSTLIEQLRKDFNDLKACTRLSKGDFEDISVIIMPTSFPCRWYDGNCSGQFVSPNTIKLGSPYVWKHEAIHYLLHINTGDSDPGHQSELYQSCI